MHTIVFLYKSTSTSIFSLSKKKIKKIYNLCIWLIWCKGYVENKERASLSTINQSINMHKERASLSTIFQTPSLVSLVHNSLLLMSLSIPKSFLNYTNLWFFSSSYSTNQSPLLRYLTYIWSYP